MIGQSLLEMPVSLISQEFLIFTNLKPIYSTATQNSGVGGWRWAIAPTPDFCVGIPTCWYLLALPPTPIPDANPKICVTPEASQWNIGGVGPSGVGAGVGHVHFMLFMSISFASGTQRKLIFQWNMGFNCQ